MWRKNRLGIEAVILILALLALSLLPIVRPSTVPPSGADAVIVLSGDYGERRVAARSLVDKGLVLTLVFVGTPDRIDENQLCQSRQRIEYLCLRPQPDNTRSEAKAVAELARRRGWRSVVVVTSRYHVTRSRLTFRRCLDAEVKMVGGDPPYGGVMLARAVLEEWTKVIYTLAIGRGC